MNPTNTCAIVPITLPRVFGPCKVEFLVGVHSSADCAIQSCRSMYVLQRSTGGHTTIGLHLWYLEVERVWELEEETSKRIGE